MKWLSLRQLAGGTSLPIAAPAATGRPGAPPGARAGWRGDEPLLPPWLAGFGSHMASRGPAGPVGGDPGVARVSNRRPPIGAGRRAARTATASRGAAWRGRGRRAPLQKALGGVVGVGKLQPPRGCAIQARLPPHTCRAAADRRLFVRPGEAHARHAEAAALTRIFVLHGARIKPGWDGGVSVAKRVLPPARARSNASTARCALGSFLWVRGRGEGQPEARTGEFIVRQVSH
jgi:hypothetical protein